MYRVSLASFPDTVHIRIWCRPGLKVERYGVVWHTKRRKEPLGSGPFCIWSYDYQENH